MGGLHVRHYFESTCPICGKEGEAETYREGGDIGESYFTCSDTYHEYNYFFAYGDSFTEINGLLKVSESYYDSEEIAEFTDKTISKGIQLYRDMYEASKERAKLIKEWNKLN